MNAAATDAIRVFLSYAKEDDKWLRDLSSHLGSRLTCAQSASRRRRVEPLAWAGVARRLRHGVPSRRNRRRVPSTRTVSAGGCPGPGSLEPSQRSITVAIRSNILTSNPVPFPWPKARGDLVRNPGRRRPRPDRSMLTLVAG